MPGDFEKKIIRMPIGKKRKQRLEFMAARQQEHPEGKENAGNQDTGRVNALFEQALRLEEIENFEEAEKIYRQILDLNPQYADAWLNLGVLISNQNNFREAIPCYKKALEIDPNYVLAHNGLGMAYDALNQRQNAIDSFTQALGINPQYADAHYNLATVFYDMEDWGKAHKHFTEYLKLDTDPNSIWRAEALGRLDIIKEKFNPNNT